MNINIRRLNVKQVLLWVVPLLCIFVLTVIQVFDLKDENRLLKHRISRLEQQERFMKRVNAYMGWATDPYMGLKLQVSCSNVTELKEYGCNKEWNDAGYLSSVHVDQYGKLTCPGLFDHKICVQPYFPPPAKKRKCVVYDFGLRREPQFGMVLVQAPFNCEVHGFDPSPISVGYFEQPHMKQFLAEHPGYHFHPYGAGGQDGEVVLREYQWGQVSILHSIMGYTRESLEAGSGPLKNDYAARNSKAFKLPVKTVTTTMKELGHTHIDILKVDVEGSEYGLVQELIESGVCENIEQLTLEWHHFDYDARFGEGSSRDINAIVQGLNDCGLYQYSVTMPEGGWLLEDREWVKLFKGMDLRYNIVSFLRAEGHEDDIKWRDERIHKDYKEHHRRGFIF